MAIQYNISASYIGQALSGSDFVIYESDCGNSDNIIKEVSYDDLIAGTTVDVSENVSSIFLVPVLREGLASDCILGCNNPWSELELSLFSPSNSPTPTPSPTPSITPTPTVTPTITPTPSPSGGPTYTVFDLPQYLTKPVLDTIRLRIEGSISLRPQVARAIAEYAANGTSVPEDTYVTLDRSFDIYTEGETFIVDVLQDADSRVKWYQGESGESIYHYVEFDNITLPLSISPPTTATDLKYLEK